jgi:hypothetical protein
MTPREQIIRTVAAMTDEECIAVFPQLRRWWLDAAIPAQPLPARPVERRRRRVMDHTTHTEIVRFVVDINNRIRFVRTYDEARTPVPMRYPAAYGLDLTTLMPEPQRARMAEVLAHVRRTCEAQTWQFPSAVIEGEFRIAHVYATSQPGHMAVSIWMVPAVLHEIAADERKSSVHGCVLGAAAIGQQLTDWLF